MSHEGASLPSVDRTTSETFSDRSERQSHQSKTKSSHVRERHMPLAYAFRDNDSSNHESVEAKEEDKWHCQECRREITVVTGGTLEEELADDGSHSGGESGRDSTGSWQRLPSDLSLSASKEEETKSSGAAPPSSTQASRKKNVDESDSVVLSTATATSASSIRDPFSLSVAEIGEKARSLLAQYKYSLHSAKPQDRVDVAFKLFSLASKHAEVQFPLCSLCFNRVLKMLEQRKEEVDAEKEAYSAFIREASREMAQHPIEEEASMDQEIRELEKEEEILEKELKLLEDERDDVREQIHALCSMEKKIDMQERLYWEDVNTFELLHSTFKDEEDSIRAVQNFALNSFARLRQMNILSLCFRIDIHGKVGRINGIPMQLIENKKGIGFSRGTPDNAFECLNAGFGYIVHLIETLARLSRAELTKYRPYPRGCASFFIPVHPSDRAEEPLLLVFEKPVKLNPFQRFGRLNKALQALLYCVQDVERAVKNSDRTEQSNLVRRASPSPPFELEHAIEPDLSAVGKKKFVMEKSEESLESLQGAIRSLLIDLKQLQGWHVENCEQTQRPRNMV